MKSTASAVNGYEWRRPSETAKPAPVPEGKSGYLGAEKCAHCHESEFKFWNNTPHASAYSTLEQEDSKFNLDCASCHVTGYDKPGGKYRDPGRGAQGHPAQVCHGPATRRRPADKALIAAAAREDVVRVRVPPPAPREERLSAEVQDHRRPRPPEAEVSAPDPVAVSWHGRLEEASAPVCSRVDQREEHVSRR
ncbi:MAG: cytochrome c family protein [Polyangiaceae bacterium]